MIRRHLCKSTSARITSVLVAPLELARAGAKAGLEKHIRSDGWVGSHISERQEVRACVMDVASQSLVPKPLGCVRD